MDWLYTTDQSILFVAADQTVARASRDAMMAKFSARGTAGNAPPSTKYKVLHIEQQGDHATPILYRCISPNHPPAIYERRLRKEQVGWQVAGEKVIAWPRAEDAEDCLPPCGR